jgi:hypothetical protein
MVSRTAASLLLVGALAACGGGDPAPIADTPAPTSFTVSGTAATGAPFAGATVTLFDSAGEPFTASGVTAPNGNYTITVLLSAKPPFVVQAVSADKTQTLVSVVAEAKDTTTNITPITNLIASRLSPSGDPTKLASELKTGTASFNLAALQVKVKEIVALLKPLMDAAGDSSDPLNGKLVADGTGADKVLDTLAISITPKSASSVEIVVGQKATAGTDSVAPITFAGGGDNTPVVKTVAVVLNGTPSVPADVALMPAASNCAALHSGTYRIVLPTAATPLADQYGKMTINAETLAITNPDGSTDVLVANGPCQYTDSGGSNEIVVSQAGVIVARYANGGTFNIGIAFPDQAHTQAELAGDWNALGIENAGTTTSAGASLYMGFAASATVDAAGAMTAVKECNNATTWDVTVCSDVADGVLSIKANADGGYDFVDKTEVTGRVFAYKAGGGELMLVSVDADGSFTMLTKQRIKALPTVGTARTSWNIFMGNQLTSTRANSPGSQTIVSVDAAAGTWVRDSANNAAITNFHPETFFANNPRNGYNFRAQGTAPLVAADGSSVTVSEITGLTMSGMGLGSVLLPGGKSFLFAVDKPS